ncbi:hypothetical protein I553_2222 [Mycobacterium xenopi 4042]|uniref:Uncharacterized protein n=1 Tax=Mycobacterium xenopi 4042 TaxID=1299334 RepID=X8DKV7_MYCXE|nr:hypothetical protein I553_2222 [Mycobacterium xenopi 4042]
MLSDSSARASAEQIAAVVREIDQRRRVVAEETRRRPPSWPSGSPPSPRSCASG